MPPRQSGQRKLVDALSPLARSVRKRWERERKQRRVEAEKAKKKMRRLGKKKEKEKMITNGAGSVMEPIIPSYPLCSAGGMQEGWRGSKLTKLQLGLLAQGWRERQKRTFEFRGEPPPAFVQEDRHKFQWSSDEDGHDVESRC